VQRAREIEDEQGPRWLDLGNEPDDPGHAP